MAADRELTTGRTIAPGKECYKQRPKPEVLKRWVSRMQKTAKDLMTTGVVTTTPCATIAEAAQVLARVGISGMPVVSEGKVVGMISDGDIITADAHATVESVMTSDVVWVMATTLVSEIAKILTENGVKRVPVVDSTGRLIGIVSRADIVGAIATA